MKHEPKPDSDLILYQTEDGRTRVQVRLHDETVWLTQKLLAELFQKDVRTINGHIQNVFEEGELSPAAVIRKFRITAADGKTYETQHYNLDVIISVGYRGRTVSGHIHGWPASSPSRTVLRTLTKRSTSAARPCAMRWRLDGAKGSAILGPLWKRKKFASDW